MIILKFEQGAFSIKQCILEDIHVEGMTDVVDSLSLGAVWSVSGLFAHARLSKSFGFL